MIINSDLFHEITGKNDIRSNKSFASAKLNQKFITIQKRFVNKFLKTAVITLNYQINQKVFSAIAGAYTIYFIDFFIYYYFFSSELNPPKKNIKFKFNIKHDMSYFMEISQNKEFLLFIINHIKHNDVCLKKKTKKLNLINDKLNQKNNNLKQNITEIFFHEIRHANLVTKFTKQNIKILKKKNFEKFKIKKFKKDEYLRKIFNLNFKPKNIIEKKFLAFFNNFYSTLFFESLIKNLNNLEKKIKYYPKFILTNNHAWFSNDKFKYYLGLQSSRGSKIIDFQINFATQLTSHNPHIQAASKFSDKIVLWIKQKIGLKKNVLYLPSLYFADIRKNNLLKTNQVNEILYFGCGISNYFKGFWSSYISGGCLAEYLNYSYEFLSNVEHKNIKILKFRIRINTFFTKKISIKNKIKKIIYLATTDGFYNLLLRIIKKILQKNKYSNKLSTHNINLIDNDKIKFFRSINYDPILGNETGIERMQKTDIIIIDHPSTPIYEALFLNKPTVIFWDKNLNFTNRYSKRLLSDLSRNKILFFSPKNAASQLNKYLKNQNSVNKLWYKNVEIQKLVKKIRNQLLNSDNINKNVSILDQWNNFLEKKI